MIFMNVRFLLLQEQETHFHLKRIPANDSRAAPVPAQGDISRTGTGAGELTSAP